MKFQIWKSLFSKPMSYLSSRVLPSWRREQGFNNCSGPSGTDGESREGWPVSSRGDWSRWAENMGVFKKKK